MSSKEITLSNNVLILTFSYYRYYHSKYKKVQTPHVIRHYAAGARLIGLSEKQIRQHLDKLRESSSDDKSPYAQPPFEIHQDLKFKKKKDSNQACRLTTVGVYFLSCSLEGIIN